MRKTHSLDDALQQEIERQKQAFLDNHPICPLSMCSDNLRACMKQYCMAWRPEKTELIKGDPSYFGREDQTATYPEHCVLMSHNEPIFPTIEKVVRHRGE